MTQEAGAVRQWLEGLGLARYAAAFADNDVDLEVLPHLSEADLERLGVSLGHRKKLMAAIARLGEDAGAPAPRAHAERRQLTVMFCDLVGSTALSHRLDPETLRELIRAYQDACTAAIVRFEGFVARYMGDGILAYFGYPLAHEDDPERAVRAALATLDDAAALNPRFAHLDDVEVAVRIGISTGLVVAGDLIGEGAAEEHAVIGETPNVAARLQAIAAPGTVVIGPRTQRLVAGRFVLADLGPQRLKGIEEPIPAWRVDGVTESADRVVLRGHGDPLPLVGREEEVELLLRRWAQAKEGDTQVVLLEGEAGIGKSRMLRAAQDRIRTEPHGRILYFGSPFHTASAFHPVIAQLGRALRLARDDSPQVRLSKLEAVLDGLGLDAREHAPHVARLLGLDEREPRPGAAEPEALRERALESLIEMVRAMAAQRPVLLAVEDAHWLDASTGELLAQIAERLDAARLLAVITYRPEGEPGWAPRSRATRLTLGRLTRRQSVEMIRAVGGGHALPDSMVETIVDKTDGVPLFVEELTKIVLEARASEGGRLEAIAIPATLQDSLTARLDHLGAARDTAQLASVFGREFPLEWLQAVSPLSQADCAAHVEALVAAGIVYRQSAAPHAVYAFKHALIQDAAYHSLLVARRREHHRAIACSLETRFPAVGQSDPALLARHHQEAGNAGPAVPYLARAGEQALARWAYEEALAHAARGFELIEQVEPGAGRDRAELGLRLVEGDAKLRQADMPAARIAFRRAVDLALPLEDLEALVRAASGFEWATYHSGLGSHSDRNAVELLERVLAVVPASDAAARARLLSSLTRQVASEGDTARARTLCEEAVAIARTTDRPDALFDALNIRLFMQHEGPSTIAMRIATFEEMASIAKAMGDRDRLLIAHCWRFSIDLERGDRAAFEHWLAEYSTLARESRQPVYQWIQASGEQVRALLEGRLDEAERRATEAFRQGSGVTSGDVSGQYGVQMFTIRREQGRLAEVAPLLRHFVETHPRAAAWRPGLAVVHAELGEREAAREVFESIAADGFAGVPRDGLFPLALAYLAEVCVWLGDAERAGALYRLLAPHSGYTVTVAVAVVCCGAADRYLGQLAALRGDFETAERHFEAAVTLDEAMRAPLWHAHSQHRHAQMLLARHGPGDLARAARMLEQARVTARALGMKSLERRIEALHVEIPCGPRLVT